jgi:hypothetical protein
MNQAAADHGRRQGRHGGEGRLREESTQQGEDRDEDESTTTEGAGHESILRGGVATPGV